MNVYFFEWELAQGKFLTSDNLQKVGTLRFLGALCAKGTLNPQNHSQAITHLLDLLVNKHRVALFICFVVAKCVNQ